MHKIILKKPELEQIMEGAKSAMDKRVWRPEMEYIRIQVTDTKIIAVATDFYRLARVTLNHQQSTDPFVCFMRPFVIPKDLIEAEIRVEDARTIVTLTCLERWLTYTHSMPGNEYPDYANVWPQVDDKLKVKADAKLLLEALKPYSKGSNKEIIISFARDGEGIHKALPIRISNTKKECTMESIVIPLRYDI